ncbi:MAG TPA: DUF4168 domain-containing protein [Fodinibius sp.]|nr:DUF4168 domain-containing protein [Fodinibius sp.]
MKFFKNMMPVLLGFLLIAGSVAQGQQKQQPTESDSVTDSELKKFADVSVESQKVQREMTEQVDSMLSEEDMDMQRFRQIMLSKRNPQMADSIEVSDKEEETMKKIQPKLMKLNQEAQQEMVSIIQDNGLEPQRFQQIMQAVRTQPKVMERFQKIQQGSQQQMQQ